MEACILAAWNALDVCSESRNGAIRGRPGGLQFLSLLRNSVGLKSMPEEIYTSLFFLCLKTVRRRSPSKIPTNMLTA